MGIQIGSKVNLWGKEFNVCGLSTMVYDKDCEGESEWKHTKEIQEVAIVEPFEGEQVFVKPTWVSVKELAPKAPKTKDGK